MAEPFHLLRQHPLVLCDPFGQQGHPTTYMKNNMDQIINKSDGKSLYPWLPRSVNVRNVETDHSLNESRVITQKKQVIDIHTHTHMDTETDAGNDTT